MLKTVEIYEPVTTQEMVDRENDMFRDMFRKMSDESLTNYIDDLARKGGYDCPDYMIAWDEYSRRRI